MWMFDVVKFTIWFQHHKQFWRESSAPPPGLEGLLDQGFISETMRIVLTDPLKTPVRSGVDLHHAAGLRRLPVQGMKHD